MTIEELRKLVLKGAERGCVECSGHGPCKFCDECELVGRALLAALDVSEAVGQWNDAQDPFAGKAIADAYDAFDAALRGDEGKP